MREFVFKNWDKRTWGNPKFFKKLTSPLDSQTRCFLFNVELLWSYNCRKWVIFYEKPHFTIVNFKFWDAGGGVESLWTKVQKGTLLRQNWSNKSFGVCGSSGVLTL